MSLLREGTGGGVVGMSERVCFFEKKMGSFHACRITWGKYLDTSVVYLLDFFTL